MTSDPKSDADVYCNRYTIHGAKRHLNGEDNGGY